MLFTLMGGGKLSLDYLINRRAARTNKRIYIFPFLILSGLLCFSIYKDTSAQPPEVTADKSQVINSINIAGSFNNWDPASNSMESVDSNLYRLVVPIDKNGVIEFKFTANQNWDINLGEQDQSSVGFPLEGTADLDENNNTSNIKAYIPAAGLYEFSFNKNSYEYRLDSLSTP